MSEVDLDRTDDDSEFILVASNGVCGRGIEVDKLQGR